MAKFKENLGVIIKNLLKDKCRLFLNFDTIQFDRKSYENAYLYFERFNVNHELAEAFCDLRSSIRDIIMGVNIFTFNNEHRGEKIDFFSSDAYECELQIFINQSLEDIRELGNFSMREVLRNAIWVEFGKMYYDMNFAANELSKKYNKSISQCKHRVDFIKEISCEEEDVDQIVFDGFLGDYEEFYMGKNIKD